MATSIRINIAVNFALFLLVISLKLVQHRLGYDIPYVGNLVVVSMLFFVLTWCYAVIGMVILALLGSPIRMNRLGQVWLLASFIALAWFGVQAALFLYPG